MKRDPCRSTTGNTVPATEGPPAFRCGDFHFKSLFRLATCSDMRLTKGEVMSVLIGVLVILLIVAACWLANDLIARRLG